MTTSTCSVTAAAWDDPDVRALTAAQQVGLRAPDATGSRFYERVLG